LNTKPAIFNCQPAVTASLTLLQNLKSRAKRPENKLAGRPATPETTIPATIVSTLVNATQIWLGSEQAIVAAVLSSPDRIGLTDEEVRDIFDYLKLSDLMEIQDHCTSSTQPRLHM